MKKVLALIAVLILSGCADSITFEQAIQTEKIGFLYGLWHGIIFPFSFLISLFSDSVSVYAIYNNGGWYDFGFFLGLGGLSSSAAVSN